MRFRDVWVGAVVTGLGVARRARGLLVVRPRSDRGSIRSTDRSPRSWSFLIWIYTSAVILLYGVEVTAANARLRRRRPERDPGGSGAAHLMPAHRLLRVPTVSRSFGSPRVAGPVWSFGTAARRDCALSLISVNDEIAMGREAQQQVRKTVPSAHPTAPLTGYVGQRRAAARGAGARARDIPTRFSIANYRELNAFALPGGPVWINRGILHAAAERIAARRRARARDRAHRAAPRRRPDHQAAGRQRLSRSARRRARQRSAAARAPRRSVRRSSPAATC